MQRTKPPFRADHVGSFLRPRRSRRPAPSARRAQITADELKAVEDREIEKIIRKQEEIGLQLATDGEYRRSWWHFDFFGMLDGVEIVRARPRHPVPGRADQAARLKVKGKIGFSDHPMLEHFKFLKAHTKVTPKMTHPGAGGDAFPARPQRGRARTSIPSRDAIFDDLAIAYQKARQGLLRRRLPLSAVRRHRLGLSVLAGAS